MILIARNETRNETQRDSTNQHYIKEKLLIIYVLTHFCNIVTLIDTHMCNTCLLPTQGVLPTLAYYLQAKTQHKNSNNKQQKKIVSRYYFM